MAFDIPSASWRSRTVLLGMPQWAVILLWALISAIVTEISKVVMRRADVCCTV